jgi:rubrerythrin
MAEILQSSLYLLAGRRSFLRRSGGAVLSATCIALLAGGESLAAARNNKGASAASDAGILNTELDVEYEGIAGYQVGAESGLLQKPVLDLAKQFQGQHKAHADLLAKTVTKLGGKPSEPKPTADYGFPVEKLKTQTDILHFAAGLEHEAASAYLGAVPLLDDRDLARVIASILGDETMHWAVLRQALGENPVPVTFIS